MSRPIDHSVPFALALLAASAGMVPGCARERGRPAPSARPSPLAVNVLADSGRAIRLDVSLPPRARVWVARVSPARAPLMPPPPDAASETERLVEPADAPPALVVDDGLKPPLLREAAPLSVPPGAAPARVELDVNVDEDGRVVDVAWAGGTRDTALVRAASRCAYAMRFFPAERAGRPIAVWCRQRFDFGREERTR